MASEGEIKERFSQLDPWLDERTRRLWAAAESKAHGRGGASLVARASGVSRRAIAVGLSELKEKPDGTHRSHLPVRQKGGGRKKTSFKDAELLSDLEKLLEPLLANIYPDALDKELERRGHCFCRYADDCNIYVGSQAAAERTLSSIQDWIEKHLQLKVNAAKSGTGMGAKVPRLSTGSPRTDRNSAGEYRKIQTGSAGDVEGEPESNQ